VLYHARRRRSLPIQLPAPPSNPRPQRRLRAPIPSHVGPPHSSASPPRPPIFPVAHGHSPRPRDGPLPLLPQISRVRHAAVFSSRAHHHRHARRVHPHQVAHPYPPGPFRHRHRRPHRGIHRRSSTALRRRRSLPPQQSRSHDVRLSPHLFLRAPSLRPRRPCRQTPAPPHRHRRLVRHVRHRPQSSPRRPTRWQPHRRQRL